MVFHLLVSMVVTLMLTRIDRLQVSILRVASLTVEVIRHGLLVVSTFTTGEIRGGEAVSSHASPETVSTLD